MDVAGTSVVKVRDLRLFDAFHQRN